MYTGAIGILDGYGMRGYLLDLAAQGYDIKTVGHSLGAGIESEEECRERIIEGEMEGEVERERERERK